MHRSAIEKLRARWVTGHRGHGAAFVLDAAPLARAWVQWRIAQARERRNG